jgi:hypothetical protein
MDPNKKKRKKRQGSLIFFFFFTYNSLTYCARRGLTHLLTHLLTYLLRAMGFEGHSLPPFS